MSNVIIQTGGPVNIDVNNQTARGISAVAQPTSSIAITGIIGGKGDANYVHDQGTTASIWNVQHNLGKKPSVTVVSSTDAVVYGIVEYIDNNNVKLTFESGAFSGKAYFN